MFAEALLRLRRPGVHKSSAGFHLKVPDDMPAVSDSDFSTSEKGLFRPGGGN